MAYISLQHVGKRYQMGEITITAVDDISFEIEKGQFAVIVGPSGAGKTTVLNILGGMDACDSGAIRVDGQEISGYGARQLTTYRRYDIGFVFQFYNLVQNLTALENVELAAQICRDPLDAEEVLRHGWPLPGRWPKTPICCCATSPRGHWTMSPASLS